MHASASHRTTKLVMSPRLVIKHLRSNCSAQTCYIFMRMYVHIYYMLYVSAYIYAYLYGHVRVHIYAATRTNVDTTKVLQFAPETHDGQPLLGISTSEYLGCRLTEQTMSLYGHARWGKGGLNCAGISCQQRMWNQQHRPRVVARTVQDTKLQSLLHSWKRTHIMNSLIRMELMQIIARWWWTQLGRFVPPRWSDYDPQFGYRRSLPSCSFVAFHRSLCPAH